MIENYKQLVENAWENRALLEQEETKSAIRECIELIDKGRLRVLNLQRVAGR